jgi:hypothetical protein
VIPVVVAFVSWPGIAQAAESVQGGSTLQLSIGESVKEVQSALKVSQTPSNTSTATALPETQTRLAERGIWVFFGPDNRALQYRFDAPFTGAIHGAKIGDSIDQTQAALGSSVKAIPNVVVGWRRPLRPDPCEGRSRPTCQPTAG